MDVFSVEELKSFLGGSGPVCVSLFMPTQRGGVAAFQNPVRLRNLLREAEQELAQRGYGEAEIQPLLQPGQALVEDVSFWEHPAGGLALFLAPGLMRRYRLPLAFTDTVAIGPHFLIRPLLPLLSGEGKFYLLTLSQNAVRLLEGTRDTMQEVALEGVPRSLTEFLQYDEPQAHQNVQYNAGRPFPGNSEPKEDRKEKIGRFFHMIDKALQKRIQNGPAPLVLAGVDYEVAIYRHVTTYPHLVAGEMEINPEHRNLHELHPQAWEVVQPYFQEARKQALARYEEGRGSRRTSDDLAEILPAACSGRVAALFVEEEPVAWGRFDSMANRIETHTVAEPGDEDLVNLGMVETLLHGGMVYANPADTRVSARPLAALYRY